MKSQKRSRPKRVSEKPAPAYEPAPTRLLLDTHIWLWWKAGDERLGQVARAAIRDAVEVRLSAASAWEMAIKRAIGKLETPAHRLAEELEKDGFLPLPIDLNHASGIQSLPPIHRDPFDRMLVSQALMEHLTIITADPVIGRYGVPVLLARE